MEDKQFIEECQAAIQPYLDEAATGCSYCNHLDPLILAEGTHSYITLAIGSMMEGYVQVSTQRHRTAATGLEDREIPEFEEMKMRVRKAHESAYNSPTVAFEHGKAGDCMFREPEKHSAQKQSLCHHVHIHMLPADIDIKTDIAKLLGEPVEVSGIAEMKHLKQTAFQGEPYLYFEDINEKGWMFPVDDGIVVPRQFLRQCVANALGSPHKADWFDYPGIEHFPEGRRKLKPLLQK